MLDSGFFAYLATEAADNVLVRLQLAAEAVVLAEVVILRPTVAVDQ